jgi:hypothetical protein
LENEFCPGPLFLPQRQKPQSFIGNILATNANSEPVGVPGPRA